MRLLPIRKMIILLVVAGIFMVEVNSTFSAALWTQIPGQTPSAPAAVWNPDMNKIHVVVRASDDSLWFSTVNEDKTVYSAFKPITGGTPSPPALAWNPELKKIHIMVRDATGNLWFAILNPDGTFYSNWQSIAGNLGSTPVLVWNPLLNKMHIIGRASNDNIWFATLNQDGTFYRSWVNIQDSSPSSLGAAWDSSINKLRIAKRDSSGNLFIATLNQDGTFYQPWTSVTGNTPSAPAIIFDASRNKIYLFVRGTDNAVWFAGFNSDGSLYDEWEQIPGNIAADSPAIAWNPNAGTAHIIARAPDNSLYGASIGKPSVYVRERHFVWTKGPCPTGYPQGDWRWWSENFCEGCVVHNPCNTLPSAPWIRDINSPSYPFIGVFDGLDEGVMRWDIRLAKAAGIDGIFGSVFYAPNDSTVFPRTREGFRRFLKVAHEENFKVAIEAWYPDADTVSGWENEAISQLDEFAFQGTANKDAYITIHGKPAYHFNFYTRWASLDDLAVFLNQRPVFWIIAGGLSIDEMIYVRSKLTQAEFTQQVGYGSPDASGNLVVNSSYQSLLNSYSQNGFLTQLVSCPGFDERQLLDRPEPRRYTLRRNGATLSDFLGIVPISGTASVMLASYNDWNEYTTIMPGLDINQYKQVGQEVIYNGDPYKYLKIIASYKGVSWSTPPLNCSIVDPLMLSYNQVSCIDTTPPAPPTGVVAR